MKMTMLVLVNYQKDFTSWSFEVEAEAGLFPHSAIWKEFFESAPDKNVFLKSTGVRIEQISQSGSRLFYSTGNLQNENHQPYKFALTPDPW